MDEGVIRFSRTKVDLSSDSSVVQETCGFIGSPVAQTFVSRDTRSPVAFDSYVTVSPRRGVFVPYP